MSMCHTCLAHVSLAVTHAYQVDHTQNKCIVHVKLMYRVSAGYCIRPSQLRVYTYLQVVYLYSVSHFKIDQKASSLREECTDTSVDSDSELRPLDGSLYIPTPEQKLVSSVLVRALCHLASSSMPHQVALLDLSEVDKLLKAINSVRGCKPQGVREPWLVHK